MTSDYEAVVYDLDGTLVRLAVDWDAVAREAHLALEECGVRAPSPDLWDVLERSIETGRRDVVETVIGAHERRGAAESTALPLAGTLPHDVPVGVVSLNCEAACRTALATHDLADHVGAVVGRDTLDVFKPDPEPLLAAIEALGGDPAGTLFVGDSARDRTTAERAGVDFAWADDWRDSYGSL